MTLFDSVQKGRRSSNSLSLHPRKIELPPEPISACTHLQAQSGSIPERLSVPDICIIETGLLDRYLGGGHLAYRDMRKLGIRLRRRRLYQFCQQVAPLRLVPLTKKDKISN